MSGKWNRERERIAKFRRENAKVREREGERKSGGGEKREKEAGVRMRKTNA